MEAPRPTPQHVLLVEDSELVTAALRVLLEAKGRRVSVARTIAEGIAAVDGDPPDVILLDLGLPDGNGLAVARHATDASRVDGRSAGAASMDGAGRPIVAALTGQDDPAIAAECEAAGCVTTFVKPVSTRALVARLDEWWTARTDGP